MEELQRIDHSYKDIQKYPQLLLNSYLSSKSVPRIITDNGKYLGDLRKNKEVPLNPKSLQTCRILQVIGP